MTDVPQQKIVEALRTASIGGDRIDLRRIGNIKGMALYVDVAGEPSPDTSYQLALAVLTRAFIPRRSDGKKDKRDGSK